MSHYRACKHANGSFTADMAKTNGLVYHWYFVGHKQQYICHKCKLAASTVIHCCPVGSQQLDAQVIANELLFPHRDIIKLGGNNYPIYPYQLKLASAITIVSLYA